MRSFSAVAWVMVVGGVDGAAILRSPSAAITPAPSVASSVVRRDGPDAVSVAEVLLTAVPESIREVAATNAAAASTILWEEFLDDSRPEWFLELPYDIQTYLISKFGPATAVMPSPTGSWLSQATEPTSNQASETTQASGSQASSAFSWPQPSQSSVATESSGASQSTGASQSSGASHSAGASQSTGASQSFGASQSSRASSGFLTSIATATGSITNPIASPTNPTATGSASAVDPSSDPSSNPTSSSTSTSAPGAPGPQSLTTKEKIGLGVGIPLGLLGAAAIAFAIILLCRRRRQKKINGSIPPSSPGFIPRFSFMEKAGPEPDQLHPLNRPSAQSFHDLNNMTWEDEPYEPFDPSSSSSDEIVPTMANRGRPVMAPALYHTHSSNRARGKRTSYQSLQSVTEVTEPDEEAESPILGRHTSPRPHPSPKQPSPSRNPIPSPPIPAASQIKRKPVPSINSAQNPAAQLASQSLLRQTMPDYSSPYSHDPPPVFGASFTNSSSSSSSRDLGNYTSVTSNPHPDPYVSPIEPTHGSNPFSNSYSYEEDYGPEYATPPADDRFEGVDGLYGGHTSLSRYPEAKHTRKGSGSGLKTEWPLRNFTNSHKRNKSPLWDRVYES